MYQNFLKLLGLLKHFFNVFQVLWKSPIRPLRVVNMNIIPWLVFVLSGNLYSGDGEIVFYFFQSFSISIHQVVEGSYFSIFNDVAEHDYTLDFLLLKHLLEFSLSGF